MTGRDRSVDRNGQQFLCGVTASRSPSRGDRRIVRETLVIRISRRRAVGSVASLVSAAVASGHFVKHAASLSWA